MQRNLLILACLVALTGCIAQSRVQARYMEAQDQCHSEAQSRVPAANANDDHGISDDASIALAHQFSDCMNKAGWHVAAPKTASRSAAAVSPATAASVPQARQAYTPQQPTQYPNAMPVVGPSVISNRAPNNPPPSPARAAVPLAPLASPGTPPAASYQPGGDDGDAGYGSGAGRQF